MDRKIEWRLRGKNPVFLLFRRIGYTYQRKKVNPNEFDKEENMSLSVTEMQIFIVWKIFVKNVIELIVDR